MTRYHHGALHGALLAAAEAILASEGAEGLTLRAAARAVGVSHAAPTHHFGDLTGLLSELAAVGYHRFADHLRQQSADGGLDARQRFVRMGKAYVGFARAHPNMFLLMFRSERLDRTRPALSAAITAAFQVLRGSVDERRSDLSDDPMADSIGAWSIVHGFALLLLDKRLPPDRSPDDLLDSVLNRWRLVPPSA